LQYYAERPPSTLFILSGQDNESSYQISQPRQYAQRTRFDAHVMMISSRSNESSRLKRDDIDVDSSTSSIKLLHGKEGSVCVWIEHGEENAWDENLVST